MMADSKHVDDDEEIKVFYESNSEREGNSRKKNFKETTKHRMLKWNEFYSKNKYGIWIECTKCSKWRKCLDYEEPHEVPIDWCCEMNISSGEKTCFDPEDCHREFSPGDFVPGSIVWAKVSGYPWWPGMVEGDPDTEEFYWKDDDTLWFNVTFLDQKVSHAWVPNRFIRSYLSPPPQRHLIQKYRSKYARLIEDAEKKAKRAIEMSIKERLHIFSFAKQYKGKWPQACNFDSETDDSIEEIKQSNTEHERKSKSKQIHSTRKVKANSEDKKEMDFNKLKPENSNQEVILSFDNSCKEIPPKLDSIIKEGANISDNIYTKKRVLQTDKIFSIKDNIQALKTNKVETCKKRKNEKSHHMLSDDDEIKITKIVSRKTDVEEIVNLSNNNIYENQKKLLNTNALIQQESKKTNKRKEIFEKQSPTTYKKKKVFPLSKEVTKDASNELSSKNRNIKRKLAVNNPSKPLKKAFLPPVKDSSVVMSTDDEVNKENCIKILSPNDKSTNKKNSKLLNSGMKIDNGKTLTISLIRLCLRDEESKPEVSAEMEESKSEMIRSQKFNKKKKKNCSENEENSEMKVDNGKKMKFSLTRLFLSDEKSKPEISAEMEDRNSEMPRKKKFDEKKQKNFCESDIDTTNDYQIKKQTFQAPTDLIVKKNTTLNKREKDKRANIEDKKTNSNIDNKQIKELHSSAEQLDQSISDIVAELVLDENLSPGGSNRRKKSKSKPKTKKKMNGKNISAVNPDFIAKLKKIIEKSQNVKKISKNERAQRSSDIAYSKPDDESRAKSKNKRKIHKNKNSQLLPVQNITDGRSILKSRLLDKTQSNCTTSNEVLRKNTVTDEENQKSSEISDTEDTSEGYSATSTLKQEQSENEDSDFFNYNNP